MSRPKRYETNADKQRAYRERKRANEKFSKPETVFTHGRDTERPLFTTKKVGELNMIVIPEEKPHGESTLPVVKPLIYKDDYGRVITEKQFNEIQDRKAAAERKGFVIDEYSQ